MSENLPDWPPGYSTRLLALKAAIDAVLAAADAKDQPSTSRNIPIALIERLREVAR